VKFKRLSEVDVRGKRLRARLDELRVVAPAATVHAQQTLLSFDS